MQTPLWCPCIAHVQSHASVNICTHVNNPKHWQPYRCLDTRKYSTHFQALAEKNNIAEPEKVTDLAFRLIFHRFSSFNCCFSVVLWLDKGDFPEHFQTVFFVLIHRVLLNCLCVWILLHTLVGISSAALAAAVRVLPKNSNPNFPQGTKKT